MTATPWSPQPQPSILRQLIEAEGFALLLCLTELRDDLNDFFADEDGSELLADELVATINVIAHRARGTGWRLGDELGGRIEADGPVVEGEAAGSVAGAEVLSEVAAGVAAGFAGPVRSEVDAPCVTHGAVAPAPVEDLVAGVVVPPDEVVGQASLEVGHPGG
jgi:hypothetical protein